MFLNLLLIQQLTNLVLNLTTSHLQQTILCKILGVSELEVSGDVKFMVSTFFSVADMCGLAYPLVLVGNKPGVKTFRLTHPDSSTKK